MQVIPRWIEYKALFYRIGLAYLFYTLVRIIFYFYNSHLIKVNSFVEFWKLCWHGLAFDTTSILYVNGLFILLSILPLGINTRKGYQKFLFYLYFTTNLLAFATNFIDFVYYRFIFGRTTVAIFDSLEHESNKIILFFNFLIHYWHVFLLFIVLSTLWIYLYKKIIVPPVPQKLNVRYFGFSILGLLLITTLSIGGIRGDFKKSTRPLNMLDASRYVNDMSQADLVLNTPFAIIRTFNSNNFKKQNFVTETFINQTFQPIKQYKNNTLTTRPNVVIFILESFAREYVGCCNSPTNIPNYKGYTPFIDSLAQHSLVFTNAYANGYKSIHGMSSVIAGIPSFKDAFTSSPYAQQSIQSLASVLQSQGYQTSFFHGAPNGSMGFLGFSNILGIQKYYGKNEFNNDAEFDGVWGIWDEPFFQFFSQTLSSQKQPFFATLFSVSSHEPYKVPDKYTNKFPKGNVNIHPTIAYTDYSLKQFFKTAQKQSWFANTIFVFTGDHCNTIYYDEYTQIANRDAIPIILYNPSGKYVGKSDQWAQHIDIYPTVLDMIGYQKPFRSWGRSLLQTNTVEPFVMRYTANQYHYMKGNYILTFDGKKALGLYDKSDKNLQNNLQQQLPQQTKQWEKEAQAFLQMYMNSIIDKKL